MIEQDIKLGIDLGGTKIEIVALNTKNNKILYRKRVLSPQNNYQDTLNAISTLILETEFKLKMNCQVGIGIPGSISPKTSMVRNANSTWLNGMPLSKDLTKILKKNITIENDANCFAISEAMDGAGKAYSSVFGAILGTGVGSGIVINKKVLSGANGISGEWGHNPLPWQQENEIKTRDCWCGKSNCIEKFISGPAIEKEFEDLFGKKMSLEKIVKNSTNNNSNCNYILDILINRIARCFASIINILDPEVIIIGGGLSNIEKIYIEVPKIWHQWIFSDKISTKVKKAMYGDSSGVRGAAWLK